MRKLFTALAVAGMTVFGVSAANAGPLTSAVLSTSVQGHTVTIVGSSLSGGSNSTGTAISYNVGSAFATTQTIPLVTAPASSAVFKLNNGGLINATPGNASATAAITGTVVVRGLGKLVPGGVNLVTIPLNVGQAGTQTTANSGVGVFVTVVGQGWSVGTEYVTGLSHGGNPGLTITTPGGGTTVVSTISAHGSWNLDSSGNGTVTLVSLSKVSTSGSQIATTPTPTFLTLTVPEPGTLLLLGAGIAGLAALGRRKRSA